MEEAKSGLEAIEEEFMDIVHTAEEVGKEVWEGIKEIFGQGEKGGEQHANKTEQVEAKKNNSSHTTRHRRAIHFL